MNHDESLPVVYEDYTLTFNQLLTYEQAEQLASTLCHIVKGIAWYWGDFLNYAEKAFPERWTQLIPSDLNPNSLRNWKWVSARYPVKDRWADVSWSVYQLGAKLDDQSRHELIERVHNEKLTLSDARDLVAEKPHDKRVTCPQCGFTWDRKEVKQKKRARRK